MFGVLAWVLLAIPVLIAGCIRLGWAGRTRATALWAAAWLAEVVFAVVDVTSQPPGPETWACGKDQACDLSWGRYVSAAGGQLVIFAIQLALLLAIASVLARGTARVSRRSTGLMSLSVVTAPFLVASWLVGTAHAPRSVVLSGVIAECTRAEYAAQGDTGPGQEPSVVTVFLQNQAGQTVAAQRLPFRVAGARYRMRVLAGIYTLAIVSGRGDNSDHDINFASIPFNLMTGNTMDVPVDWAGEQDFNAANESCLLRRRGPRRFLYTAGLPGHRPGTGPAMLAHRQAAPSCRVRRRQLAELERQRADRNTDRESGGKRDDDRRSFYAERNWTLRSPCFHRSAAC